MMARDSFIMYKTFWKPISRLSDEQLGRLTRAVFKYQCEGDAGLIGDDIFMAFEFMKMQFDVDNAKYAKKCENMRNNARGNKSGRIATNRNELKQIGSEYEYDDENEYEYENENVDDDEKEATPSTPAQQHFEYLKILFFRNIPHAEQETRRFVNFYESTNWTLEGGEQVKESMRTRKASVWTPQDQNPRFPVAFLSVWLDIFSLIPDNLKRDALSDKLRYTVSFDKGLITCSPALRDYIISGEVKPKINALLKDGRLPEKSFKINTY